MLNIPLTLRIALIIGSCVYFGIILMLLKKKKLNVQYSIIWLASAVCFLLVALFPIIIAALGNLFNIQMPANLVFAMLFMFVLLLLLSLSTIVTGFAHTIKRLTQHQALLEERVRQLEKDAVPAEKENSPIPPAESGAEPALAARADEEALS